MNLEHRLAEKNMSTKSQQCTSPLRLPIDLKEWAKRYAKANGLSLNALVISMLQRQRSIDQANAE